MASPSPPAASPAPTGVTLERGQTIDRFVVLGLVGRGGMGEVYAAYDPELDRKIAIKLLRARGDAADGRARLLREAQAIAKLSHPNVVVVYDVGTFRDSVFIAMEFVEGRTLTGWLQAGQRSRRDVLQVFLAAGRGLAAAHAAGLVHRDFKPDNVMVTNDGQVRVMDFGLARQTGDAHEAPPAESALPVDAAGAAAVETFDPGYDPDATMNLRKEGAARATTSGKYLSIKLTQTGAMLGTPAYMAPEQFAMRPTDARTDQFSFCVALYECLYDQRPFEGETFLSLMTSVSTGAVRAAPAKTRVPGWMRKVVLRGLETDPDRRYPSIAALLAAIDTDPTVRPKRLAAGAALLVVAAFATLGARRAIGTHEAMCRGGAQRWDGIWEVGGERSASKEAIRASFAATGKSFAAQTYVATARLLDDYVSRWTSMYRETCEATQVRGEQSAEVLDLRMGCLRDRLANVHALTDVFAKADETVVANAVSAAGALPPLEECADVVALREVIKPPEDLATRKRVAELREELARVTALRDSGGCAVAEKRGVALIDAIRPTKYRPLLAQALNVVGFLGNFCADPQVSANRLKEAHVEALAGHDDRVAAEAAANASLFLSDRLEQIASAEDWLMIARGSASRMVNEQLIEGFLLDAEANILLAKHDVVGELKKIREAADVTKRVYGPDHYYSLTGLANVGNTLSEAGRYEEAIAADETALTATVRVLGPDHPLVASISNNECEALGRFGRFVDALRMCRRAMAIWEETGADPVIRSYGLTGIGLALLGQNHAVEAIAPLEEAVTTRVSRHLGPKLEGETRFALARALWSRPAEHPRALALARQARVDASGDVRALAAIDGWLARPAAR